MIACSKCKREIPASDFNVATDIAYCRNCNVTHKFSDLLATINVRIFDYSSWPKHIRYYQNGAEEVLVYKKVSPVLLFLIPFFALWSGGSMTGIYIKPIMDDSLSLFQALFGIPFLLGTVVLLSAILFLLLGSFRLVINGGESYLGWGIAGMIKKKCFDAGNITAVQLMDSSIKSNRQVQQEIVLRFRDNTELKFGAMLEQECKQKLAEFLAAKKSG